MPLHIAKESTASLASAQSPVVWHGAFWRHHSLALVNRELTLSLLNNPDFAGRFALSLEEWEARDFAPGSDPRFAPLAACANSVTGEARVTIRHRWPPEFSRPDHGKLVLIQPWEFGSLPREWVTKIESSVDEVWVPSQWVRDCYLESGVAGDKVVVVPNGVNTLRFHPGAEPFDFKALSNTRHLRPDTYKFLFVGGTIARKGIDVLLDAYDRAFTSRDDVTLIIKDFGTSSFYANQGMSTLIRALQAKPGGANIVYLDGDMSEAEIAGLYAACDCLVHPYRGEGYGLPIAEAMACGKPTMVTGIGAACDFANDSNAYLIPARRASLTQTEISGMATVAPPFWAEPNRDALIEMLRGVVGNRDEAKAKGEQAARDIAAQHTWAQAANVAAARLGVLADEAESDFAAPASFALPMGLGNLSLGGLKLSGLNGLSLSSPPGAAMETVGAQYEERKQAALVAARQGEFRNAATLLEACLVERPDDWDLVNALAVVRFRTGDTNDALALLRRGIADAPAPRDFYHNLAFVLLAGDQPVEALEHALKAFAYTPDETDLRRTVERAGDACLVAARKLLRSVPDSQRAQVRRHPEYRALMQAYQAGCRVSGVGCRQSNTELQPQENIRQSATQGEAEPDTRHPIPDTLRLSICMIVKNEERFLRNCLQSAQGLADEIVIVDTGSTDGTLAIAREFGAKIVEYAWNDDFSAARNVSLDHATGDWALWLDADEEIAPGAAPAFRDAIQNAPPQIGGYMVRFQNWLSSATRKSESDAENGEMAVHHACRLFRRVPGVRFEGRIHEQNLRSLQSLGYGYAQGNGLTIDHFGYAGEIMTLRNKHERFIRMLRREVEECPDETFRYFHRFNLGNAYFTLGDMENAAYWLEQAAEKPDTAEEFTLTLFTEWATALHRLGRAQEGLAVCKQADALGLRHPGVDFARGYCFLHLSRYSEAEFAFQAALKRGATSAFSQTGDAGIGGYKARYGLALALVGQDRYGEATTECHAALDAQPGFVDARYLLALCLTKTNQLSESCRELETVLEHQPDHGDALRDLGANRFANREYDRALPYVRSTAQADQENYEAQARLASCCEHLALFEEAREAYERLRMLSPNSPEVCVNLGRVLAANGATDEAIDAYADAIYLDPQYGNAYFNAGDLLYQMGFYDRAAETYLAGLEVAPEHESGFFVLGNCYVQTQDYEAAAFSYRQALTLQPGHNEARHNLELALSLAAQS